MEGLGPEPLELSDLPAQQQQEILAIVDVERAAFQVKLAEAASARAADADLDSDPDGPDVAKPIPKAADSLPLDNDSVGRVCVRVWGWGGRRRGGANPGTTPR